ncbi:MAG: HAD-IB family phosphatase [Desulfurococcales archaeon]|nr:HAD-IB family phosphatase [Desulfurococcales archaeon]
MARRLQLVFFDVDGVLVNVKSSWEYLHRSFGVLEEARKVKRLFEEGAIDYVEWMRRDTMLWIKAAGGKVHRSVIIDLLSRIEVNPEARPLFRALRKRGIRIALVSSGIDLLVRRVAVELGVDAWAANKLEFDREGFLKPGGVPLVGVDKSRVVYRIANELGASLRASAYVGDSRWDASAMKVVGLPIAYGDDPSLDGVAKARVKRLSDILEVITSWERGLL